MQLIRPVTLLMAFVLLGAAEAAGAPANQQAAEASALAFLKTQLAPVDMSKEARGGTATRVQLAWADLNGDQQPEAIAYVSGGGWCGTGGCRLMVLERSGATYRIRGKLTVTRRPIGVLVHRTSGWRDLAVDVRDYRAAVPFDGERYAPNPTVAPAHPLAAETPEEILIVDDRYPLLEGPALSSQP